MMDQDFYLKRKEEQEHGLARENRKLKYLLDELMHYVHASCPESLLDEIEEELGGDQ